MVISIEDKMQCNFMIKVLENAELDRTYLNTIKAIYEKPTADIILNGENVEESHWSQVTTRLPTVPTPLQNHA